MIGLLTFLNRMLELLNCSGKKHSIITFVVFLFTRNLFLMCYFIFHFDIFFFFFLMLILQIQIKRSDPSTLICEKCKSEVIHFHNFLLKSLRVNEYFEAITKEVNNKGGSTGGCIELIRIDDDILEDTVDALFAI